MEESKFDFIISMLGEEESKKVFKSLIKEDFFKTFGIEGTEDYLKENLKKNPRALRVALEAYQEILHA